MKTKFQSISLYLYLLCVETIVFQKDRVKYNSLLKCILICSLYVGIPNSICESYVPTGKCCCECLTQCLLNMNLHHPIRPTDPQTIETAFVSSSSLQNEQKDDVQTKGCFLAFKSLSVVLHFSVRKYIKEIFISSLCISGVCLLGTPSPSSILSREDVCLTFSWTPTCASAPITSLTTQARIFPCSALSRPSATGCVLLQPDYRLPLTQLFIPFSAKCLWPEILPFIISFPHLLQCQEYSYYLLNDYLTEN